MDEDFKKVLTNRLVDFAHHIVVVSYRLGDFGDFAQKKDWKIRNEHYEIKNNYTSRDDYKFRLQETFKSLLAKEQQKYLKKFGRSLNDIIERARNGDDRALFKLIKFDKAWLYLNWVEQRILLNQRQDNKDFFNKLSDAMRYKLRSRNRAKSQVENLIYNYAEIFSALQNWFSNVPRNDFFRLAYKATYLTVVEENMLNLNDTELKILDKIHILNDEAYF